MDLDSVLTLIKKINASQPAEDPEDEEITLAQLFEYILEFPELRNDNVTFTNWVYLMRRTCLKWSNETQEICNVGEYISLLIEVTKHDKEDGLESVVLILYQIIRSLSYDSAQQLEAIVEPLEVLIDILFERTQKSLISNILLCIKLYVDAYGVQDVLMKIWQRISIKKEHTMHFERTSLIFVHLFDAFAAKIQNFVNKPLLIRVTQTLMESNDREERKMAIYLLKKRLPLLPDEFAASKENSPEEKPSEKNPPGITLKQFWLTFITIMENLDENQSHLILPCLEQLKNSSFRCPSYELWMKILYRHVFQHTNTLVVRWAIEHFLTTYDCEQMNPQVLCMLLEACNDNSYYNVDAHHLPMQHVTKFLQGNVTVLLETMPKVPWKPVPLHFWLAQIVECIRTNPVRYLVNSVSLLTMASRVRALQNPRLREAIIYNFEIIFANDIKDMGLEPFVTLVETLCNTTDCLWPKRDWLSPKLSRPPPRAIQFGQRFYEVFRKFISFNAEMGLCIKRYLDRIPTSAHSWLRYLMVFDYRFDYEREVVWEFVSRHYCISMNELKNVTLADMMAIFCTRLAKSDADIPFIRRKAYDYYLYYRVVHQSDRKVFQKLPVGEVIEIASAETLELIGTAFNTHLVEMDEALLGYFAKGFHMTPPNAKMQKFFNDIMTYSLKMFDQSVVTKFAESVLGAHPRYLNMPHEIVGLSEKTLLQGLLLGDPKTGDARSEALYELHLFKTIDESVKSRECYASILGPDMVNPLLDKDERGRFQKRYYECSQEHRNKLRTLKGLLTIWQEHPLPWSERWERVLLDLNNQPNIAYAYEYIVSQIMPNWSVIEKRLSGIMSYTPGQQLSIISVAHCFYFLHGLTAKELKELLAVLLPLTMGANFQVRQFAQLVIYKILTQETDLDMCLCRSDVQALYGPVKTAIVEALGDRISDLLADVRLELPNMQRKNFFQQLMYVTCAPFDEWDTDFLPTVAAIKAKVQFMKKRMPPKEPPMERQKEINILRLQRKLNPPFEMVAARKLTKLCEVKQYECFVVASLVDRLPNLGGIARSCEVLGIKNLVISSKHDLEKNEFKSLSMTAEKSLNIVQVKPADLSMFLMHKRIEGFKVVGAEQTTNSVSFSSFQFPAKCVLLLGQEKEGILPELMDLLDYVVEVPQFGLVRSLNVHVTAALFMWEYCKQHIVKKTA